jgi:hypothetical protein
MEPKTFVVIFHHFANIKKAININKRFFNLLKINFNAIFEKLPK